MTIFIAGAIETRGFQYIKEAFHCCSLCDLTPDSDSRENICQFPAYLTTSQNILIEGWWLFTKCKTRAVGFVLNCSLDMTMHTSLT